MARTARRVPAGYPLHVTQRGHNRAACFHTDGDRNRYLALLAEASREHECRIHAYVLMTNHVHLLVSPDSEAGPARMMKAVAQRHAQFMNWKLGKVGPWWQGRFHSVPITTEHHLMACYRYIELNPVRARLTEHPRDFRWSSYRSNAEGAFSAIVRPHDNYFALAATDAGRQAVYRGLFTEHLDEATLYLLRRGPQRPKGRPKGSRNRPKPVTEK